MAAQVRHAFFGAEVQRIQRGRDDVRVMLRYPVEDRKSLGNLPTTSGTIYEEVRDIKVQKAVVHFFFLDSINLSLSSIRFALTTKGGPINLPLIIKGICIDLQEPITFN